jgi:4-hydroxy-3-polyprenylbenzoate decarboxylase
MNQRTSPQHGTPQHASNDRTITVGVTGASGALYARAILQHLEADPRVSQIFLVITETGLRLIATELNVVSQDPKKLPSLLVDGRAAKTTYLPNKDVGAVIASGSAPVDAMVVIPCSAGALAKIAHGLAEDLLSRASDVCLKERRPLVLCIRETPFNRIHLENMLHAHDAGAIIMPAMPAFYYGPKKIDDLAEQYVCRVLSQITLPQDSQYRWGGTRGSGIEV